MRAVTLIDGRDLEPPEPFVRTMQALAASEPGQRVLLRLMREPFPLYQALASQGYAWQTERGADGTVEVLIWRA
jgi:hypothetical protein